IRFIPISALHGDNVVERSDKMNWYDGSTLLYSLETIHIGSDQNHIDARFPVQTVIRPHSDEYHDYRGYAGRVAGGIFRPGDEVIVQPSGFKSKIRSVDTLDGPIEQAFPPMSVTLTLEDDIDVSRGDMIVRENNPPRISQDLEVMLCWLHESPMRTGGKYVLRHTSSECRAMIKEVVYKMNISDLTRNMEDKTAGMNDIVKVHLRTTKPIINDPYRRNRQTGSIILVDETTNETVAAGMIV
ncbi:MAG: sulfate adenylyltransferase, partial [Flavobacteriia bacterium]|nr:sulfate adenylyltransferase [Flavobacteriia bacterium]